MRDTRPPEQGQSLRTKPARRAPPKLARSIGPHLARLAKASGAMDPRLAEEWASLIGPELAPHCRPSRIVTRGRTQALEVAVSNGAAAMRLEYQQDAILARVRQRLGLPRLSRIVIRQGKAEKSWSSRRMSSPPAAAPAAPKDEAPVKSEGLRAALEAMRRTVHDRNR
ncbi:MAG: DUF721 domain-containing protein [Parvularcula sp.]|jgi:hypothetical protein|nr:DUF721 domain-containing protein [Parvularcula sp.]